jgi:hypothetical protein
MKTKAVGTLISPQDNYATSSIFHCRLVENLAKINLHCLFLFTNSPCLKKSLAASKTIILKYFLSVKLKATFEGHCPERLFADMFNE